ncbi:MAG TPA: ABC transporter permease subunit [Planctomycetota bacterium]|nr:ABC transporter permease subunit [Planctomycetota bacterium]
MSKFAALVRRELGVYFVSPTAYIILTALLFISGWVFHSSVESFVSNRLPSDYQPTLLFIEVVIVLTSALVTMRLVAEEKSRGTLEILLTSPVTEAQVVLGKFLATLVFLAFILLPTVGFAIILARYGSVDFGQVFCGYLGVMLLGAAIYSIGLFISSLCMSQITAGMITFSLVILLVIANLRSMNLPENSFWRQLLEWVNLGTVFGDFMKGVIDLGRLVYLVSISGFFLFLTTRILETRRWR